MYISGILVLLIVIIFLFFPEVLLISIIKSTYLPLGTFITWIGLISYVSFFYYLHQLRMISKLAVLKIIGKLFTSLRFISYFWGFIAYLLAANWSMTFYGSISVFRGSYDASLYYWGVIYGLLIIPVLLFFISLIVNRLNRK